MTTDEALEAEEDEALEEDASEGDAGNAKGAVLGCDIGVGDGVDCAATTADAIFAPRACTPSAEQRQVTDDAV